MGRKALALLTLAALGGHPTGTVLLVAGLAGATVVMAIAVANMKIDLGDIVQAIRDR